MESVTNSVSLYGYAVLLILSWLATRFLLKSGTSKSGQHLPPGPTPVPIFGNLFLGLGPKPHQRLAELAATYGPLMTLRHGMRTAVVVSSSSAARDVFLEDDLALSNRGVYDANTALDHDKFSMIWLPNGPRWRYLRKISNSHMFSGTSLDGNRHLRQKKVAELMSYVERCCGEGEAIDIGDAILTLSLNFMSNTIFSMDLADPSSSTSREFKQFAANVAEIIGKPNLSDFFPFLRPIDPQGIRRRVAHHLQKVMNLIDGLIGDRLAGKSGVPPESEKDILGILLKLSREENSEMTRSFIAHIILDLLMAGTDTSASTIEYAMAELIRNPEKMKKLREELHEVIGRGNSIEETDIVKLPYLEAVMKETLRLHPPIPLATRRSMGKDIEAGGYIIPKGSRVWLNLWAIGRDPEVWPNPQLFDPERHAGTGSDFRGKNFELIPFGSGRRICPGLPLVMRMGPLVLGSLVHSFDWKLENMATSESLDMEEEFGITVRKADPLRAIPFRI